MGRECLQGSATKRLRYSWEDTEKGWSLVYHVGTTAVSPDHNDESPFLLM
jgi:hypothetical protein